MKTIQVKPWGKDQGDFVEINEEDFDKGIHELYVAKELTAKEKASKQADETKSAE